VTDQHLVKLSKYLSRHLRHQPERIGLTLGPGGWVRVDDLLAACRSQGLPLSRQDLDEVVARNNKQRFAFDDTGMWIRAHQGHSVDVDLGLPPAAPPERLYHGTGHHSLPLIFREGLHKMTRHHVHLSEDPETARQVGARHGRPIVLLVNAGAMQQCGYTFYRTANGVWLTDEVPPEYLCEDANAGA
jgi:putative RNA 2'-phosphotransferase